MNMQMEVNSRNGVIEFIGITTDKSRNNYIASPIELPLIGADTANKVEGYSAVLIGYRQAGDERYHRLWADFQPVGGKPDEFVFVNEHLQLTKRFKRTVEGPVVIEIEAISSSGAIAVEELALSVPVNNDYSPWRYDQRYLYDHKVYEHLHPGGGNGYQLIERLNGASPLVYCIPLGGTRFEHLAHAPGSTDIVRPLIQNHSWPGSTLVFLHARGYLERNDFQPLIHEDLISAVEISDKEPHICQVELGFIKDRESLKELMVHRGEIHTVVTPGMTGPVDAVFQITAFAVGDLSIREDENIEILAESETNGGRLWTCKFRHAGQQTVEIAGEGRASARLTFWITDPLEDLLERRADFILNRQVYRKEGDVLDGVIAPYTVAGFEEFEGEGLYVKEDSTWGNGSYEGGITDAIFAAEKNVWFPNGDQIEQLEAYIERYVRRYLQNPQTHEVIWWFGEYSTTRAYGYVHTANLYYSMYLIAKTYRLTEKYTAQQYLTFAYETLMKMYEVSRPMDLVAGFMGGQRIFEILDGFKREEMVEFYYTLLLKVRYQSELLFGGDVPYGSECPYDNTGYECVAYFAEYFRKTEWMSEIGDVMLAARGDQPVWWWHGSDIRWWDASKDFAETCQHYTSPLNSSALLMLIRKGYRKPSASVLSSIYGGLLGSTAKIHEDGRASMSYCWEQESANFGQHAFTGDVGLSLFGTLLGLRAFLFLPEEGGSYGYLGDARLVEDGNEATIRPVAAAGRNVSWHGEKERDFGDIDLSSGTIRELTIDRVTGKLRLVVQAAADFSYEAEVVLRLQSGLKRVTANGDDVRFEPIAANEYRLTFPVHRDGKEYVIEIERMI